MQDPLPVADDDPLVQRLGRRQDELIEDAWIGRVRRHP